MILNKYYEYIYVVLIICNMYLLANISGMIGGFFVMIFLDRIANFHNNRS